MKREIRNIIKTFVLSIIFSVSISIFIAYATPPTSPYLPGETLDPNCSPGDPNCTVLPSLTGTSTPGNIGFYTGTTTLSGDAQLFWDNTNKRLGIGTSAPAEKLHIEGNLKIGGENNLLFVSRGKRESNYGGPYDWYRGFIYLGRDLTPSDWYTDTLVPGVDSGYIVLGVDTDIGAFMPAVYDPNTLNYIRAANIEGASGVFQGDLYLQKSEGSSIFFKPGGNLVESSINFDDLNKKLSFIIKNPISTPFEFKTENPFSGNFLTIFNSSTNIFTLSSNGDIFASGTLNVSTGTINNSLGIKTSNPLQPLHVQGNSYISGNLGIGVSNPTNNLEVSGTSALFNSSGDFRIAVSKGAAINTASILFQNNFSGRAEFGLTGDDKFHIKTSPDGSTWIESLVVDSNGNVGIGTTAPQTKLHIEGGEFWLFNNGNNPRIVIGDNGVTGQYGYLQWDSMNDYYRIETDGTNGVKIKGNYVSIGNIYPSQPLIVGLGSTELFIVDSNGNVGIGTTNPGYKLDVQGSIRQTNAVNCALSADANGQIICTISSQRYKTNIRDLNFDINKFLALNPRSFDWNTSTINFTPGEKGSIGFIAEEVNQVFPELVRYKDGQPEGIKYEILPVYLFKVVKDLILGFTEKVKASLNELGIIIENGAAKIEKLFVKEITINFAQIEKAEINELTSKKFCLEGDDGETICLDKNQLKELLNRNGGSYTTILNNYSTTTTNNTENTSNQTANTSTSEGNTTSTNENTNSNQQESVSNPHESVDTNTTSTSESNTNNQQESVSNQNQSTGESTTSSNEAQP
jgi:hypothetical protein